MSYKVYENLIKPDEDALDPSTQSIIIAIGAFLQSKEKCDLQISIGNSEFKFTTVVAHSNTDGILGLNFLKKNRCLVDVASAKKYIRESENELQLKGHLGCFNVSLRETECLPPRSETICPDPLSLPSNLIICLCVRLKT